MIECMKDNNISEGMEFVYTARENSILGFIETVHQ